MGQSEPTTGEIVREARRVMLDAWGCAGCDLRTVLRQSIDRLESQERELSVIAGELEKFKAFHERYAEQTSKKYVDDICALTARAESAERERDAVVKSVDRLIEAWENFKSPALIEFIKQWRGKPQEGDGL